MHCAFCASSNQAEFPAEVNIHFSGVKNLDRPSVMVFPKLLVCLDCGFSQFTSPAAGLALLTSGAGTREASSRQEKADDIVLCV